MKRYNDYDILFYTDDEINGKAKAVVEYDSGSNRPFMVYTLEPATGEYEPYSGEDGLDIAIDVAINIANLIHATLL